MESYQVNKISRDDFGRVSGVFAFNKPAGVSSHDIVYKFRRHFETKKVGHAGTLDPFADGLLVVLVGKATKLSDTFLNTDKEYRARILFGIETNSGDPEGDIVETYGKPFSLESADIQKATSKFSPSYNQSVPLFSSVKLGGKKLRELARSHHSFKLEKRENGTFAIFYNSKGEAVQNIQLPSKTVNIYKSEVVSTGNYTKAELIDIFRNVFGKRKVELDESEFKLENYQYVDLLVSVSKGTYIRQLAIDIGTELNKPAMLIELTRTKVGDFSLEDTYEIDETKK